MQVDNRTYVGAGLVVAGGTTAYTGYRKGTAVAAETSKFQTPSVLDKLADQAAKIPPPIEDPKKLLDPRKLMATVNYASETAGMMGEAGVAYKADKAVAAPMKSPAIK